MVTCSLHCARCEQVVELQEAVSVQFYDRSGNSRGWYQGPWHQECAKQWASSPNMLYEVGMYFKLERYVRGLLDIMKGRG